MALNYVVAQGKLVRDAEAKPTSTGKNLTVFCIACQRNYKNSQGKYDADFIDCVAYDKTGDVIRKYFSKGSEIIVSGEFTTNTYEDKNGTKHKVASIVVNKVYFCGSKQNSNTQAAQPTSAEPIEESSELPFE